MSFIDTLLSSSRLLQRRVKLNTCSGLERHLQDELNALSLKFDLVSRDKSNVDILASLDTIWSIIQNSRICRQLSIHVCYPFQAETTKQFVNNLNSADWASFIPFSNKLPAPSVKVTSHNSKLYHTGMIQNILEGVINSHCYRYKKVQGDELPEFMKNRGYVPICPKITVDINNDSCQVLADASGDLSERPWHKLSLVEDRIVPSASAAVIQELASRNVFNRHVLTKYLINEKMRIDSSKYPLTNCANEVLKKLKAIEEESAKLLVDVDNTHVKNDRSDLLTLKFECKRVNEFPVNIKDAVILTNLYYGNKQMKSLYSMYYKDFSKFVKSVRSRCNSIYAIAPKSFKRLSGLNCEALLVFNNNGIIVELMKIS
ncbi:conserved hypothetical protein [Theileria orientalis strain Shintoku]|uniref:Uncharacterized protein n=1 Tax=Theileria orientalis strain Shintoku TaxID=869250 RepID=J4DQ43_THEOR|nr:conserved hypothetical protein [Theileria orientalis strain Shintoku]BAM41804.1 conserved hypothetical protein [Theileria orientalis strain Shintoku]|eukprot:XP_009692105.1 conserved hypothetical protein [Theileria orientalis strain Shintoku]